MIDMSRCQCTCRLKKYTKTNCDYMIDIVCIHVILTINRQLVHQQITNHHFIDGWEGTRLKCQSLWTQIQPFAVKIN